MYQVYMGFFTLKIVILSKQSIIYPLCNLFCYYFSYFNNLTVIFIDLTGGDPLGQFAIENIQNEWKVYVKKPLDREKRDNYLLTITATDGTFSSKAIVEVKVLDANDNSPVCEKVGCSFF